MKTITTTIAANQTDLEAAIKAALIYILPEPAQGGVTYKNSGEDLDLYFANGNEVRVVLREHKDYDPQFHVHYAPYFHSIAITILTKEGREAGTTVLSLMPIGHDVFTREEMKSDVDLAQMLSDYENGLRCNDAVANVDAFLPLHKELTRVMITKESKGAKLAHVLSVRTTGLDNADDFAVVETGFNEELLDNPEFREKLEQLFGSDTTMRVTYYLPFVQ
jgi:hypothetical protein